MWHGYQGTFSDYLENTAVDRFLHNEALDELIDLGNARPNELR